MSKNKAAPHPYIYQRFPEPSKDYSPWGSERSIFENQWPENWPSDWHLGRLEYRTLYQNQWMPPPTDFDFSEFEDRFRLEIWRAMAIPSELFKAQGSIYSAWPQPSAPEPRGYRCACVLDRSLKITTPSPMLMKLDFSLVQAKIINWDIFLKRYPLALDYIDIRLAYQDYIVGQILKAPARLWRWLTRKRK